MASIAEILRGKMEQQGLNPADLTGEQLLRATENEPGESYWNILGAGQAPPGFTSPPSEAGSAYDALADLQSRGPSSWQEFRSMAGDLGFSTEQARAHYQDIQQNVPGPLTPGSAFEYLQGRAQGAPGTLADVAYQYGEYGIARDEMLGILGGYGDPARMTREEASFYMGQHLERSGGPTPNRSRYSPTQWYGMQGGKQAQASSELVFGATASAFDRQRAEALGLDPMQRPGPEEWEKLGMVSRQGAGSMWSPESVLGSWQGIPGQAPGTVMMSQDPNSPAGMIKGSKRSQQFRGSYVQPDFYDPMGQSMMKEAPLMTGPASTRYERGFSMPITFMTEEWLQEGMMIAPTGSVGTVRGRSVRDFDLSQEQFESFASVGETWQSGMAVQPYAGAGPVRMGLGRSWDWAQLKGVETAPGEEEGMLKVRAIFETGASTSTAQMKLATGPFKFMVGFGSPEQIHGKAGYAASTIKDPAGLPYAYWMNRPEEAASALGMGMEEYKQKRWSDVGYQLTQKFREDVLPQIYEERDIHLRTHEDQLGFLPQDRGIVTTPIEGQEGMYDVMVPNVGTISAEWFVQGKREYSVRRPNIPYQDLQVLERANPQVYREVMQEAAPTQRAYRGIIGAAMATHEERTLPGAEHVMSEDIQGVLLEAQERVQARHEGVPLDQISEAELDRAIVEQASQRWGETPLIMPGGGTAAAPAFIERFGVEGESEFEEASAIGRRFGKMFRAAGTEEAGESEEAYMSGQAALAGGKKFLRRSLAAYGRRTVGGKLYSTEALAANEIVLRPEQVMEGYRIPEGKREEFEAKWKAGEINPSALMWGQPSVGSSPWSLAMNVVHPDVARERGMQLEDDYDLIANPSLMEARGRDADGDYAWARLIGAATKKNAIRTPEGVKVADASDIERQAEIAKAHGRASLVRGKGTQGLEALQETLSDENLHVVGPEEFTRSSAFHGRVSGLIGPYHNILDDISMAGERLGVDPEATAGFKEAVHGRTQTPTVLPEHLGRTMQALTYLTPKGGIRDPLGGGEFEDQWEFARGRGLGVAQREVVMNLAKEEAVEASLVAQVAFPGRSRRSAEKLIEQYRSMSVEERTTPLKGQRGVTPTTQLMRLAGSPEDWATQTAAGQTIGSHLWERAKGTPEERAVQLGIERESTGRQLSQIAEENRARRVALAKRDDREDVEGLAERVEATRNVFGVDVAPTVAMPAKPKSVAERIDEAISGPGVPLLPAVAQSTMDDAARLARGGQESTPDAIAMAPTPSLAEQAFQRFFGGSYRNLDYAHEQIRQVKGRGGFPSARPTRNALNWMYEQGATPQDVEQWGKIVGKAGIGLQAGDEGVMYHRYGAPIRQGQPVTAEGYSPPASGGAAPPMPPGAPPPGAPPEGPDGGYAEGPVGGPSGTGSGGPSGVPSQEATGQIDDYNRWVVENVLAVSPAKMIQASARMAQYGGLFEKYIAPRLRAGQALTGGQRQFAGMMQSALGTLNKGIFQLGQKPNISISEQDRLTNALELQRGTAWQAIQGSEEQMEQLQISQWLGLTNVLGGVTAEQLTSVQGIGEARAGELLAAQPQSFSDVQAILSKQRMSPEQRQEALRGVMSVSTPWQRLGTMNSRQLESIPGVGPQLAQSIQQQAASGGITSLEDLMGIKGVGEKKAMSIADALATPEDKTEKALRTFTEEVERSRDMLKEFGKVTEDVVEKYRQGEDITKGEAGVSRQVLARAQAISGAAQKLGEAGVPIPREIARDVARWGSLAGGARDAQEEVRLSQMRDAIAPQTGGELLAGLGRGVGKLASGWSLMQMRRMWGMTGGPVFSQMIPAAAQAEMQGWGLTQAIGGYTGGIPEGVAGGVMQYQAAQSQAQIEGGRAGYRAWGDMMQTQAGLKQAQGIFGPAVGAGLIANIGLKTLGAGMGGTLGAGMAAAAGPVALAATVIGSGIAAENYMTSYGSETAENQLELADQSPWAGLRAFGGRILEEGKLTGTERGLQAVPGLGYIARAAKTIAAVPEAIEWTGKQAAAGVAIRQTAMGGLDAQQRMAGLNWAAQQLHGQKDTLWSGMDEGQILKSLGQFAAYDPRLSGTTNLEDFVANMPEEYAKGVSAGISPAQATGISQQLGMGTAGTMGVYRSIVGGDGEVRSQLQMTQRMATLSQYAGMKRFGISGQEVQGNIDSGRWEELTGAGATLAGRLSGGDPYAWSEMAQQGMAPAWANRMGPGGMAQGTFGTQALQTAAQAGGWGGRVGGFLGGLQNAPGAIQSEAGGTIEISTGQVTVKTGGKIGVEDWSTAENRGYQRWQFGQQREALQAQETYTRASWGLQDQQTALGYQHQQANFGFQWEQLGMQDRQFYERRGIQGAQMQAQISWGQEDMARNFQRQMTQFDWAEEDLAYQGTQSTLHYAWGQEDIREQMRYATGRQRRQLMKQEQRATIDYAMGMGRLDTQGERLDERRGWAEEDFNREKDRYQQRSRWSMQLFELQGKHHEENMDLQRRRLTENERYFEDNHKLQEEARDLQREYWEENHERQEKALEMSEKHFEVMTMIQDVQREIDRNMQMQTAAWNQFWASGGEFESAWRGILDYINSGMPGSSTSVGGSHDSGLSWME